MFQFSVRRAKFAIFVLGAAVSAAASPVISLVSPTSGSTPNSPVFYKAFASTPGCPGGIRSMEVATSPGVVAYKGIGSRIQTFIPLAPGNYNTVIVAFDRCGGSAHLSVPITVSSQGGVSVYSPTAGSTSSPVTFSASASSPSCAAGISRLRIFTATSVEAYGVNGDHLNAVLALPAGHYNMMVQATDNCGNTFQTDVLVGLANPPDKLLYESTNDVAFMVGYHISSTGSLSFASRTTTNAANLLNIVVDPTGHFLYAASQTAGLFAFRIDRTLGKLSPLPGSPYSIPTGQNAVTGFGIDTMGNFLFVADSFNHITTFAVDWQTGVPRLAATLATSLIPLEANIVTDASGQFVYVVEYPNALAAYQLDWATGVLTEVLGSPFAATTAHLLTTNRFLYGQSSQNIAGFNIDTQTGSLMKIPGSPFPIFSNDITVDPVNDLMFVGTGKIETYKIDMATGVPTFITSSSEPGVATVGSMEVDQSGKFLYGLVQPASCFPPCQSLIESFTINPLSGGVSEDSGPFLTSSFGTIASFAELR